MRKPYRGIQVAGIAMLLTVMQSTTVWAADVSADEIVNRCDITKNKGEDQVSIMTLIKRDSMGVEKKEIYRRYWKASSEKKSLFDKMVLVTDFPPDARGTAFMRWGYTPKSGKNPDQWLYLPALNTVRRVSVRDPGDSFLGSEMTYQDIGERGLDQDTHVLLREEERGGKTYYVVESTPKEASPLYRKVVSWFAKTPEWSDCNKVRIEYTGAKGSLLKTQTISWQMVDGIWVWQDVSVENLKTGHTSLFNIKEVKTNVGLKDKLFTERRMKRGIK